MKSISVAIYFLAIVICVNGESQSISMNGTFLCDDKPLKNTRVEMYERDFLDPHDFYNFTMTDEYGRFELFGREDEYLAIEPYIIIKHNCGCTPDCRRTTVLRVPAKFINGNYNVHNYSLNAWNYGDYELCGDDDDE